MPDIPQRIVYNKLVRDGMRRVCELDNNPASFRILTPEERIVELRKKLVEEVHEYAENPCNEELGDVMEVLNALVECGAVLAQVKASMNDKLARRGGFNEGLFMEWCEFSGTPYEDRSK
jgi:predicted house-cleaning noncanonical NTP pyrophosphatase (MazG superfamily)